MNENMFDVTIRNLGVTTPSAIKDAEEWFIKSKYGNDKVCLGEDVMNQIYRIMAEYALHREKIVLKEL